MSRKPGNRTEEQERLATLRRRYDEGEPWWRRLIGYAVEFVCCDVGCGALLVALAFLVVTLLRAVGLLR